MPDVNGTESGFKDIPCDELLEMDSIYELSNDYATMVQDNPDYTFVMIRDSNLDVITIRWKLRT
jgi:hypothetical protein